MKITYNKVKYVYWIIYGFLILIPSDLIKAQSNGSGATLINPLGSGGPSDLTTFVKDILQIVIELGAIVVVFFIIFAGFKYVTAGGDEKKIKDAHSILLWTVVGAAIILGAQVLLTAITGTINELGIGN